MNERPPRRLQAIQRRLESDPHDREALSLLLIERSRIEGEQAYLTALDDRDRWNLYSQSIQDQCISVLDRELGEQLHHTKTRVYQCAGVSHRIATFQHSATGDLLNLIPGGSYQMGSNDKASEKPVHKVTIKPMLIGRYPVRQCVWDKIGGADHRRDEGSNNPIESCSWNEVKSWLEKTGDDHLRLPSEAEWEYACRAGNNAGYFWSEPDGKQEMNTSYCWFQQNSDNRTHSVIKHSSHNNAFGLVDMLGNVFEWCEDTWIDDYRNGPKDHRPRGTHSHYWGVGRGGSWMSMDRSCRVSHRGMFELRLGLSHLGFRLSRSLTRPSNAE